MGKLSPHDRSHWPLPPDRITPGRPDIDRANTIRALKRSGWDIRYPRRGEKNRPRVILAEDAIRMRRGFLSKSDEYVVSELGHELVHVRQVKAMGDAAFLARYATRRGRMYLELQAFAWEAYVRAAYGYRMGLWAKRFGSRTWWWKHYRALPNREQRALARRVIDQAIRDGRARRKLMR